MMASHPDPLLPGRARAVARLGVLAAVAIAVYVFEGLLPTPLPWAKLGLSNVVVVFALFGYGLKDAFVVNLARIVVGNLALGLVASPAFFFSLAGSTAALGAMAVVRWRLVPPLSVAGASCLGAVVSNVVQVLVFSAAFAPSGPIGALLGIFILLGVGIGLTTGLVASAILARVGLAGPQGVH